VLKHSSSNAISLLYCRTCSIGICANVIGRLSATVSVSAMVDLLIVRPTFGHGEPLLVSKHYWNCKNGAN
jgi:hypothetical protein